jgi:PHP family Zn ribbon phosphoesterase
MEFAVDLHMHSVLSPCSDRDMTPNNIVNMAVLKGLDFIAVTDHNSAENLEAVCRCAEGKGLVVVPGMEVETSEEIHLLCLFPDRGRALQVQDAVYASLPPIENREDIFGSQQVMDENDLAAGKIKQLLLTASGMNTDEIFRLVGNAGGVAVPAHVDRQSYSMLSNLGSIPEHLGIKYLELSKYCGEAGFRAEHPELAAYKLLRSSDAHHLGDMLEREMFLELKEKSVECLLKELKERDTA